MKEHRVLWLTVSRPRDPQVTEYREYKEAKAAFRRAHRQAVHHYLASLDSDLEEAAKTDSALFWKILKSRKAKTKSSIGAGIKFGDSVYRSREDLTTQWAIYFSNLYSPANALNFDEEWKRSVHSRVSEYFQNVVLDSEVFISAEMVEKCIKTLPRGKAGGPDGVCYEHLIHSASVISAPIANLFTRMLINGKVPEEMKKGEIITLHKGGKKSKEDPNNYRAITLSSVILKLFEVIILNRCQKKITGQLSFQQGGFQKHLGCIMTSFILHETLHFAREQSSKVYICCLDGRQAFDHVWHDGLFAKLLDYGIDTTSMKALREMYTDATCKVRYNGLTSEEFPVMQGTRQGGKSSPLMYLVFIDGLIRELEASGLGVCLYGMKISSPTLADDMTLLAFSKTALDIMLKICWNYSCRWRYFYNAKKCGVLVLNDIQSQRNQVYFLGNDTIQEKDSLVHLGIALDKFMSCTDKMYDASIKLRGTYMNIYHNGIKVKSVSPVLLKNIYVTAILPKALYGSELWNCYSQKDMLVLERAHRFCIKHMQLLGKYCNTNYALALIDIPPIETIIDKRKLLLFGQLCRLPQKFLAKQVFVNRLMHYLSYDRQTRGFFPDIQRLLYKYNLKFVLDRFLESGIFPSKQSWKHMLYKAVDTAWKTDTIIGLRESVPYLTDSILVRKNSYSGLWDIARECPNLSSYCYTVANSIGLFISGSSKWTCPKCKLLCKNIIEHQFCYCAENDSEIKALWCTVIDVDGIDRFKQLMISPSRDQCGIILKAVVSLVVSKTRCYNIV